MGRHLLFLSLMYLALLSCFALADTPSGSITIYGTNGTVLTSSRNVFLNLSYSSSDGIGACRWANDLESNLALAPWEDCTVVKAWLLSESFGYKDVFYQIKDINGHTANFTDSILYRFMQDITPPTSPIVYDGLSGPDIAWWSDNTTLGAHWFNSTEDISTIYYRYRMLDNGACYEGDCNFSSIGTDQSATLSGLGLIEGRNYSFEVEAYNPSNLSSLGGISDGVIIDITKPAAPGINSSHSGSLPSDIPSVRFNWTSADPLSGGVSSGIAGYSYLLDKYPGTSPPNVLSGRYWEILMLMHKGSYNQTLKVNSTGAAYAVFSQLHTNFSVNDSLRVRVALAEQLSDFSDLMRIKVYLTVRGGSGNPIAAFDMESSAISNIAVADRDIRYAEGMTLARVYEFNLTVNATFNDDINDLYVVVAGVPADDDNRNHLAIGGTTESSLVDNSTKNFVCSEGDVCSENTSTLDYAIEAAKQETGVWRAGYDYLADGIYYFHVKARDLAGNWGDPSHYKVTIAAGGVDSLIFSPIDGESFYTPGIDANITVRAAVSANASVYVVAKHPDGSNYTSGQSVFNTSHDFENVTLELGLNELYLVANSSAGVLTRSESIFLTLSADLQASTNKTLRISYGGCTATPLPYLCNRDEGTVYVGIGTEVIGSVAAPYVQADTDMDSLKIYATKPFDVSAISSQLARNIFLDRINPLFGFTKTPGSYIISQELRYDSIYLGGNFLVPSGTYKLYIIKSGVTADGRYNITLVLG